MGGCPARAEARDSTPGRGRSLLEVVAPGQRFPLLRGQYDELLVGGAVHPEGYALGRKGPLYLHGKLVGPPRPFKILAALQHECKLQPHQPALCQHRAVLLHVRLEAVLEAGLRDDEGLAEKCAALCPADIEHVRKLRKVLQGKVVILCPQAVPHPGPVHEQVHAVFFADLAYGAKLPLGIQGALLGGEGNIYQLGLRKVLRGAALVILRRAGGDLPRGELAVGIGEPEYLVAGALDGGRLVAVDMPGVGRDNALYRGKRRRNRDDIRLRRAGDEFYHGVLPGDQLLYDRLRPAAPLVLTVARIAGGVDFRKPVEYGLKGPPVIVVVKSYHFKYLLVIPQPAASPYRILSREFIIQPFMPL